jgi:ArsR family transcriptional regulator
MSNQGAGPSLTEPVTGFVPVLRALADPVRLHLLAMMAANPTATAGELSAAFEVSQPTVSHHLKTLYEAGLVVRSREGTSVSYRVNPAALERVAALLTGLAVIPDRQPADAPAKVGRPRAALAAGTADQVLQRGAEDLTYRFAGVFAAETVDRAVHESYQALYRTAAIKAHVPVLALRFVGERLTALAQAEGRIAKPLTEVLLLCTGNAGRSQVAAGYLRALGAGKVHVRSAGSTPGAQLTSSAPRTWSSPWAAVMPAHSTPASGTSTGTSPTPKANPSTSSAQSPTPSKPRSPNCWSTSEPGKRGPDD